MNKIIILKDLVEQVKNGTLDINDLPLKWREKVQAETLMKLRLTIYLWWQVYKAEIKPYLKPTLLLSFLIAWFLQMGRLGLFTCCH